MNMNFYKRANPMEAPTRACSLITSVVLPLFLKPGASLVGIFDFRAGEYRDAAVGDGLVVIRIEND